MIPRPPRVVVVDDHPLLAAGLKVALERVGLEVEVAELTSTVQASDAVELSRRICDQRPDCAVLDLKLPFEGGGLALVGPLATHGVKVVVLTGESDMLLWTACADAGAEVVLSKSEPLGDIVEVIARVCTGDPVRLQQRAALVAEGQRLSSQQHQRLAPFQVLSHREREILAGLMEGHGPAELAERDFVSIQTVRTQVKCILRKLAVTSQLEAVARAHACGWRLDQPAAPAEGIRSPWPYRFPSAG